jgi:hypothetical protein
MNLTRVFATSLCLVVSLFVSQVNAAIINVAFGFRGQYGMDGVASNNSAESATSGTAAPLAYTGTKWNEPGPLGAATLLTSTGRQTAVGLSLANYPSSVDNHGGSGILRLLGAGIHADGPSLTGGFSPSAGVLPALTLTGLDDSQTYTLVIVSGGSYDNINEWNVGGTPTFTDPQTSSGFTGGTTLTTSSNTNQRGTWVSGVNYVAFTGLQSVGGTIIVRDRAINDKFSINGFQLAAVPEPGTWALGLCGLTALVSGAFRQRRRA